MLSAPTPDYYLPLLYVLAQHRNGEPVSFPVEGFDAGSISMRLRAHRLTLRRTAKADG